MLVQWGGKGGVGGRNAAHNRPPPTCPTQHLRAGSWISGRGNKRPKNWGEDGGARGGGGIAMEANLWRTRHRSQGVARQ